MVIMVIFLSVISGFECGVDSYICGDYNERNDCVSDSGSLNDGSSEG